MFTNLSFTDFTVEENRNAFATALSELAIDINGDRLYAAPIINGREIKTANYHMREDPSETSINIGKIYTADAAIAKQALETLSAWQQKTKTASPAERARLAKRLATILQERRLRLAALMVREAGKPWREADADLCEAVDFCNYYADEAIRIGTPQKLGNKLGELNLYCYKPRGVSVVISPWNFPLAITCGMAVAALVTGNATIIKPSGQSAIIGFELAKAILEAGFPPESFAFLPGSGSVLGPLMVEHPSTALVAFTGSKEVGLDIMRRAAVVQPGQYHLKKVIAELGGKNAIIVDEDADFDEAIKGVLYSAFGYSGQKCSAASRLIVVGGAYENFVKRLCMAARDIIIGKASDAPTLIGPVIDATSKQRLLQAIEQAKKTETLLYQGEVPISGHYVPPTIFGNVKRDSAVWREELFGPVLACVHATTFEEALQFANDSQYALTGGVFSRSPVNIEKASEEFLVGNLYLNRGSTGAMVERQPFGGFKLSGIGSKAGGPDYLLQFVEPRVITENTMRRGFSPDL